MKHPLDEHDEQQPAKTACHRCWGRCCDPFDESQPCLRCGAKGIEPAIEELEANFGGDAESWQRVRSLIE